LAVLAVPGVVLLSYLSYLTRANHAFGVANTALLAVALSIFVADGVIAMLGLLDVRVAVGVWAAAQYVGCAYLLGYLARATGFGRPDRGLATSSVRFGLQAHGAGLLNTGAYRLDQWLLGALAGAGPLGVYSVAVAWFEGLFLIPTALSVVARPSIVEAASDSDAVARARTTFHVAMLGVIVAGIGTFLAAPILCGWLFGSEFAAATGQLRLLVPGAAGIVAVKVLGSALTARGRPRLETAGVAVGFAASAALYFLLIPRYGATGAAIASTIGYLVAGIAIAIIFLLAIGGGQRTLMPSRTDLTVVADLASKAWFLVDRRRPPPCEAGDQHGAEQRSEGVQDHVVDIGHAPGRNEPLVQLDDR
jgi:O-antigen/teichoic acid export membrane protein